ncbi:MAG TPA: hypothetical protein VGG41_00625 [Solirubrobacteraceae bacterium]
MPQQVDSAEWNSSPWAGTLDQLKRAGEKETERIVEAAPTFRDNFGPDDFRGQSEREARRETGEL